MKFNNKVAIAAIGAVVFSSFGAYLYSNNATAAENTTNAQPATGNTAPARTVPRHPGVFAAGAADQAVYTPTCPAYVFDMDATAIQESRSRAFVEQQAAKFRTIREGMDSYEDCLTENARVDIDIIRDKVSSYISDTAAVEVANFTSLNGAATTNVARIRSKGNKKVGPKGETVVSTYVKPEGRKVGTVAAGPLTTFTYNNACPAFMGEITTDDFNTETNINRYNALLNYLSAMPAKIDEVRACRNDNAQKDYDDLQNRVQDGVNAVFIPIKSNFERQYQLVNAQLNLHREPGGLLAAPATSRTAPPSKAKKKR